LRAWVWVWVREEMGSGVGGWVEGWEEEEAEGGRVGSGNGEGWRGGSLMF